MRLRPLYVGFGHAPLPGDAFVDYSLPVRKQRLHLPIQDARWAWHLIIRLMKTEKPKWD